jgi:hypothetical protein
MRDLLSNYLSKAIHIFNFRDDAGVMSDLALLRRILEAVFDPSQVPFLDATVTGTDSGILNNLSPHERACILAQALAGITLFLDKLADEVWPTRSASFGGLRESTVENRLREIKTGSERKAVLETIEASPVFSACRLVTEVGDLILRAVEGAEIDTRGHFGAGVGGKGIVVEDDSELEEISLSFVNDKGPNDIVLPNGLRILQLN